MTQIARPNPHEGQEAWKWCMDWCKKQGISPAPTENWERAVAAYKEKEKAKEGEDLIKNFINVMSDIVREVSLKVVQVGFHLPEISISFNERYDIAYVHLRVWTDCEAPYFTHYREAFTLQEISHLRREETHKVISHRFLYQMERALNEAKGKPIWI